ncbi:hypothetical protein M758_6G188800 [Ceratodon purpureus]|nr:hypothetical protein M758_6G188800 [Ceratodon purpureus]
MRVWRSLGLFRSEERRSMVKAVRVHTVGGRHHVQVEEVELPRPGCNEVEVRHTAIGLNYPDVEDCRGGLHARHTVYTPGSSAVGVITELGTGVLNHQIGQRVGYVNPPNKGAFSEASVVPITCLVPLPSNITDEEAAALLFPGFTAWMALKKLFPLRRGDPIVVNNLATGLGSVIAQWAKHLKAVVIGIVSSEDDVEHAKKNGCNEVVVHRAEIGYGFADEVRELTSGDGVAAVFDLVGKSSFTDALLCLAPKGMYISLGATAGDAPVLNFKDLAGRGSLVISVPVLADYVKNPAELLEGAQFLFELHKAGAIKMEIAKKFPLNMISKALDAMAKGEVGSCILIPPIPDPKNVPHGS